MDISLVEKFTLSVINTDDSTDVWHRCFVVSRCTWSRLDKIPMIRHVFYRVYLLQSLPFISSLQLVSSPPRSLITFWYLIAILALRIPPTQWAHDLSLPCFTAPICSLNRTWTYRHQPDRATSCVAQRRHYPICSRLPHQGTYSDVSDSYFATYVTARAPWYPNIYDDLTVIITGPATTPFWQPRGCISTFW